MKQNGCFYLKNLEISSFKYLECIIHFRTSDKRYFKIYHNILKFKNPNIECIHESPRIVITEERSNFS